MGEVRPALSLARRRGRRDRVCWGAQKKLGGGKTAVGIDALFGFTYSPATPLVTVSDPAYPNTGRGEVGKRFRLSQGLCASGAEGST